MSIFSVPKAFATKIVDTLSPACGQNLRRIVQQPQETDGIRHSLEQLEGQVHDLRAQVETLNRDLDESRRLNLRAAELMDIAFTQLAK